MKDVRTCIKEFYARHYRAIALAIMLTALLCAVAVVIEVDARLRPRRGFIIASNFAADDEACGVNGRITCDLRVTATAYTPWDEGCDGITATGGAAVPGVAAVDPRVIPLGTVMQVPGYGIAVAADTGGAIRGRRVDLCLPSRGAALKWGRRDVTVTLGKEVGTVEGLQLRAECEEIERRVRVLENDLRALARRLERAGLNADEYHDLAWRLHDFLIQTTRGGE